jgi:hypothetical protein
MPYLKAFDKLYMEVPCLNADEKEGYVIKNSFEVDKSSISFFTASDFETKSIQEYLNSAI